MWQYEAIAHKNSSYHVNTLANHWLVKAAVAVGAVEADKIKSPSGTRTAAIWEEIERVSGTGESELVTRIAKRLRLPVADLSTDARALKVVPEKIATQYMVLPLKETNQRLSVATADPMDFLAEQSLGFASGRAVDFELAGPRAIERALRDAYAGDSMDALVAGLDESLLDAVLTLHEDQADNISARDAEARPIVKLTNLILSDAVRERASDIHIQPVNTVGMVRFRIDGVMRGTMQLPLSAVPRIISRIKVLAQLNIADRVRPQDGHARLSIKGREYDLRVSTVPVGGGEKAVIRILAPANAMKVPDLGLPAHERDRLERLLRLRDGVIAVTGPTGSGKTTTLYAALRQLSTGENNIVTVEDPIEYRLAGVSQMQADPKRGVTFASALRAVLRQDPDVILIGEMRDSETATIGIQAAMTGHLVLATLHTNDAVGTIPRLVDLGIDRNGLADTLRGAVGQRLLRRLCKSCAEPTNGQFTEDERKLNTRYGVEPTMRPRGCDDCGKIGYHGRLSVVEVLVMTPALQELITAGASSAELQRAAVAGGMRSMVQVGLDHVRSGATTLEEVERVLGDATPAVAETESDPLEAPAEALPHILVVDDDPVIRQLAKFVLGTADYKVLEAENGRAALEFINRGDPVSVVVLDLDMPEMGGLEVLKALRANRATVALPVVILTASDKSEADVMDAGADDYIRKPLDPERFLARIKAVLRRATI